MSWNDTTPPAAWRYRTHRMKRWHYTEHKPGAILRMRCAARGDIQALHLHPTEMRAD